MSHCTQLSYTLHMTVRWIAAQVCLVFIALRQVQENCFPHHSDKNPRADSNRPSLGHESISEPIISNGDGIF
jgi:hypothetical protein